MPKAFLVRKKLTPNWCPATPPPSPDDIVPGTAVAENLTVGKSDKYEPTHSPFDATIKLPVVAHRRSPIVAKEDFNEAVDLSTSSRTESSSSSESYHSPHYRSSLSSPMSYTASESEFDFKLNGGKFSHLICLC